MYGEIKYIGRSPEYTFLYNGRSEKFKSCGEPRPLPLQNCRELIQNGNFIPTRDTFHYLKQCYFEAGTDVWNLMKDQDVYIVGSGSSLQGFDFNRLKGKFTIALNHSMYHFDSTTVLFIDRKLLKDDNKKAIGFLRDYKGIIFSAWRSLYHMESIKGRNVCNFSLNGRGVHENYWDGFYNGKSSGLVSLGLALILGARHIFLLGFDYDQESQEKHFYNKTGQDRYNNEKSYTAGKCKSISRMYDLYSKYKDKITNLNPKSRLTTFPFGSMEAA